MPGIKTSPPTSRAMTLNERLERATTECTFLLLKHRIPPGQDVLKSAYIQSTPDNSNLQGKSKKVRVIGSSSYRELEKNSRE